MKAQDLFRLDSKVAAIVGAGSGIGEATAQLASELGATVVCIDVNAAGVEAVAIKGPALEAATGLAGLVILAITRPMWRRI